MIAVDKLGYEVNGRTLVNDISFEVAAGEFWAILGANGAGKSTLMKLLSREYTPSNGSIAFHGQALSKYKLKDLAKKRAVLAQQNNITLSFSAEEIVLMGRYPYYSADPSDHDLDIVDLCLRKAGVAHLKDRLYPTLSGGEQQRVQVARTLAQIWNVDKGLLLLDEPTTGMDLLHQYETFKLAKEMAGNGYGVIAVVHDLNHALQYADKVLVLKSGQVISKGEPEKALTEATIKSAFGLSVQIIQIENLPVPIIIPDFQQKPIHV